jgi:RNA polymerase sigma-70 factor (ECF subfamily)
MDEEMTDEEVARRVEAGRKDLFRLLVERHERAIFALLWRQCRNASRAEELAQETFLRAFRSLAGFRGESSFRTWLFRIALNLARSNFHSRQWKEYLRTDFELPSAGFVDGEAVVRHREEVRRLLGAVERLDRDLQEVTMLCLLESYSYAEAAEVLELPLGTVASRMHRALKTLRAVLTEKTDE